MKKTLTINVGGVVFHINEDAFELLKGYLDKLHAYFDQQNDGSEIMSDIETRIAELLSEKIVEANQVVTLNMIHSVIEVLGQPEDFTEVDDETFDTGEKTTDEGSSTSSSKVPYKKPRRKLYRDPSNKVFGGVCSGLAIYFNIDLIAMRVIFVILLLITQFTFGIIYIVLWIAVPEAVSVSQRLEMMGEPVNVNNIGKEFNDIKNNAKNQFNKFQENMKNKSGNRAPKPPHPPRPPRPPRNYNYGSAFGDFFMGLLKFFGIFIGSLLIVSLAVALFAFIGLAFGSGFPDVVADIWHLDIHAFPTELARTSATAATGIAICIGVPIFLLAYFVSKLAFRHQGKTGWVLILSFFLWFTGFIMVGSSLIKFIDEHGLPEEWRSELKDEFGGVHIKIDSDNDQNIKSNTFTLDIDSDTLYIDLSQNDTIPALRRNDSYTFNRTLFKKPDVAILHSKSGQLELGVTEYRYKYNNTPGDFNWSLENDTLHLPYAFSQHARSDKQTDVKAKLKIPEGYVIYLIEGNGMENFNSVSLDDNDDGFPSLEDMHSEYWTMTNKGLKK